MTLPPERITIKRRRDDEPVEALYIEQKRHCSRSAYWVRLRDGKSSDVSAIQPPRGYSAPVICSNNPAEAPGPNSQIHFPIEDVTPESLSSSIQIVENAQGATGNEKLSTRPVLPNQGKTIHAKKLSSSRPRVFHFSKGSKSQNSPSLVSLHGIKKSKAGRRDLAVFEEKIKATRDPCELNAGFCKDTDRTGRGLGTPQTEKRTHANPSMQPAVSAGVDLVGREFFPEALNGDSANWRLPKGDGITECSSEAAFHEPQKEQRSSTPVQPQLKFQPKPITTLREEKRSPATSSEVWPDAHDPEGQDDFVFDTYLRTNQSVAGLSSDCPMNIDHLELVANGKIGILVIEEEDEAAWEAYGEELESDKDWNSEEEDENAEDYYGNDYPEDEVDSDDEYGRDAYQYRNNDSDNEEFDQDWSHDEDGGSFGYGHRHASFDMRTAPFGDSHTADSVW